FATWGNPNDTRIVPTVAQINPCVVPYEESGRECTPDDPTSPAARAGLEPGDEFVSFNGIEVTGWEQLSRLIRDNAAGDAEIVVRRDGELERLTTNTIVQSRPTSVEDETLVEVGFLGVYPERERGTGGVLHTLDAMAGMTVDVAKSLASLPAKVYDVGQAIVGVEERDPEGPMSVVGGGRLAGETTAHEAFPVQEKAVFLLMLIAGFNFFIGMFNFVPLLPLD